MSAGCLTALVATLIAFDERARRQVSIAFGARSASNQLAYGGSQVRDFAWLVFQVARDQSLEHAPLMIFVVAALVLTLFMLRT